VDILPLSPIDLPSVSMRKLAAAEAMHEKMSTVVSRMVDGKWLRDLSD